MQLRGVGGSRLGGFGTSQRLLAFAVASLAWTPSVARGQEKGEVACTDYEVSEAPDSTSGGVRMRTRTSPPGTGFLGLATVRASGSEANPGGYPKVDRVYCGYPAYKAGLRVGDLVLAVNERDARQPRVIAAGRPGTVLEVRIQRGQEVLELKMVSVRHPRPPRS